MKIWGIIPARGGSKGLPGKNIRRLLGKPLISYIISEAKKSKYLDRVLVSTDSEEIAAISKECGAEVPFLRPAELATDSASTVDAVIHAVRMLQSQGQCIPEFVCVLQCTSPLTVAAHIDGIVEKLIDSGMDGAVSVCESEINPYWLQVFHGERLQYLLKEGKSIARRQELPPVYRINGAIYLVKTEVLLSELTLEPEKITGYIMESRDSIDIDNEYDFLLADYMMRLKRENEENRGCNRDEG